MTIVSSSKHGVIMPSIAVKNAEFKKQLDAHKQTTVGGQFNTVKAAVENLQLSDESSLDTAVKAWADYQLLIKSLIPQT